MKTSTSICCAVVLVCLLSGLSLAQDPDGDLETLCVMECDLYRESVACDCDQLVGRGLTSVLKRGGAFPFRYGKRDVEVKRHMPFRYGKRSLEMSYPWWAKNSGSASEVVLSDLNSARSLAKRQFRYGKRSASSPVAATFDLKPQDARSLAKRQFRYGKRSASSPVAATFDLKPQDARSLAKRQFRYGKRSAPSSVADLLGYNLPNASALKASSSEEK